MAEPYTIHIYVPDGDPEGIRLISRMNWTGLGLAFPRAKWPEVRQRFKELSQPGVYILVGDIEEDDRPTLYIGQGEEVRSRVDFHYQSKDFWNRGIIFISSSRHLNRAHITWLEYGLIDRADRVKRCHLDNGNMPQEPALVEAEKADTMSFLKEILQILPLVGIRALESSVVAEPKATTASTMIKAGDDKPDTVIVPAQKENFEKMFLGEKCWYSIRISGGMLERIKFIAVYVGAPVKAITHYAPVNRIEPYGETSKYKLVFSEAAKPIGPIPLGRLTPVAMMGPKYTTFEKLKAATKLSDLVGRS